jgi:hypothetical protein
MNGFKLNPFTSVTQLLTKLILNLSQTFINGVLDNHTTPIG